MNYIKFLVINLIFIFLFASCAIKDIKTKSETESQKTLQNEDELIIKALYFKENGDLNSSLEVFNKLYENSKKDIYRLEIAEILGVLKEYQKALEVLEKEPLKNVDENRKNRLLLQLYILTNNQTKGEKLLEEMLKKDPSPQNDELAASFYINFNNPKKATKHLESAYNQTKEPQLAIKIADITYLLLNNKQEAITFLTTHAKIFGCDGGVCDRLIFYHKRDHNLNGMAEAYKMLYNETKDTSIAKEYIEVLIVKKDYELAQKILEESKINDTMLLEIYKVLKKRKLALNMAKKLYEQTQDLNFLAEIAMLEYELAPNRNDKNFLKKIDKMLSKVLASIDNDTYQNFLGYILIDHDYDIDRGIELVLKALKKNPNSAYYLDSLAWGYYKKKDCKRAFEVMQKVMESEDSNEAEIKEHWEKIKECIQKKNKHNKSLIIKWLRF